MTQPAAYQTMISPRSRRLRTVGILLLLAVIGMSVYGARVIMPPLRAASRNFALRHPASVSGNRNDPAAKATRRERRVMQVQLLSADVYWLICGLLALAAIVVAWLDFREVSRNYLAERRALMRESARRIAPDEPNSERISS